MKLYEISNRKGINPSKKFEGLSFGFWCVEWMLLKHIEQMTNVAEMDVDYRALEKATRLLKLVIRGRSEVELMRLYNIKIGYTFPILSALFFMRLNKLTVAAKDFSGGK